MRILFELSVEWAAWCGIFWGKCEKRDYNLFYIDYNTRICSVFEYYVNTIRRVPQLDDWHEKFVEPDYNLFYLVYFWILFKYDSYLVENVQRITYYADLYRLLYDLGKNLLIKKFWIGYKCIGLNIMRILFELSKKCGKREEIMQIYIDYSIIMCVGKSKNTIIQFYRLQQLKYEFYARIMWIIFKLSGALCGILFFLVKNLKKNDYYADL